MLTSPRQIEIIALLHEEIFVNPLEFAAPRQPITVLVPEEQIMLARLKIGIDHSRLIRFGPSGFSQTAVSRDRIIERAAMTPDPLGEPVLVIHHMPPSE